MPLSHQSTSLLQTGESRGLASPTLLEIIDVGPENCPEHGMHGISPMLLWLGLFLRWGKGSGEIQLPRQAPGEPVVSSVGSGLAVITCGP